MNHLTTIAGKPLLAHFSAWVSLQDTVISAHLLQNWHRILDTHHFDGTDPSETIKDRNYYWMSV
jgi:hypothetical protein